MCTSYSLTNFHIISIITSSLPYTTLTTLFPSLLQACHTQHLQHYFHHYFKFAIHNIYNIISIITSSFPYTTLTTLLPSLLQACHTQHLEHYFHHYFKLAIHNTYNIHMSKISIINITSLLDSINTGSVLIRRQRPEFIIKQWHLMSSLQVRSDVDKLCDSSSNSFFSIKLKMSKQ